MRVWDARSGKLLHKVRTSVFVTRGLSFDPSGQRLLVATREGDALIWPFAKGGKLIALHSQDFRAPTAVWSPDGRTALVTYGAGAPATLFDASTGRAIRSFGANHANDAVFSPDGRTVATAGPGPLAYLWSATDGHELRSMTASGSGIGNTSGAGGVVTSVRFSANGRYLLDRWLRRHRADLRRLRRSPARRAAAAQRCRHARGLGAGRQPCRDGQRRPHRADLGPARQRCLPFPARPFRARRVGRVQPDGKSVLTAGDDGLAQIFDTQTGTTVAQLRGHGNGLVAATFSPDGRAVATAGEDGTVRLWDTGVLRPTTSPVVKLGAAGTVCRGAGRRRAGPAARRLLLHQELLSADSYVPGGTIVDTQTGKPVATLAGDPTKVTAASFDGDGGVLFTAEETRALKPARAGCGTGAPAGCATCSPGLGAPPPTACCPTTARAWRPSTTRRT